MRVLLYDFTSYGQGHHLEYAGHLVRSLDNAGDQVAFATWSTAFAPPVEEALEVPGETIYVGRDVRVRPSSSPRYLTRARALHRCLNLGKAGRFDVLHLLCLDRRELITFANLVTARTAPDRPAVFATLFKPFFVSDPAEKVPLGKRMFRDASSQALGTMMRRNKIRGLFVHSQRTKDALLAHFGMPSWEERIRVVPDPAKEGPRLTKAEAREQLGLTRETPVFLFFGDLRRDKGPDVLLEALTTLPGTWTAIFAGLPVSLEEEAFAQAESRVAGRGRIVRDLRFVPEEAADRYMRAADAIVLPYRSEFRGTSGVLRRAAAAAVPVIATDVGDVGAEVRQAALGLLASPDSVSALAEALTAFLERMEEWEEHAATNGPAFAGAHDWRVFGESTRKVYAELLTDDSAEASSSRSAGR